MSKNHARGRLEKLGASTSHNHGYFSRNNAGADEKRPSVFDRLGTRRYERDNSNSVAYASSEVSGGTYKGRNEVAKTHVNAQRTGHSSTKRSSEVIHGQSRSRSVSPRMKKKTNLQSSAANKNKSIVKPAGVREKDKISGRKGSPKRTSVKTKSKSLHSSAKRKSGGKSKKTPGKSKGKIRSSSLSSEDSSSRGSSTSSSRSRTTSSTATEASSSSVSGTSSSSESSAPSIKLKPAKKDKTKKKTKKKSRSTMRSSVDKPRHVDVPSKRQSVSSSGSSRDSRKESAHVFKDRYKATGTGNWHKSPSRRSDSYDRRSFSKSRSRPAEKEIPSSGRNFERVGRSKERGNFEEDTRKRRLSDDPYAVAPSDPNYMSHKRSRTVPSPPPKYNKVGTTRRTPSPSPRRIPPDSSMGHKLISRNRSPLMRSTSKERERLRIIRSPPRRPSFEDHRRIDLPRKERPHGSNYGNGNKFMDQDRDRDRPYPHPLHAVSNLKHEKPGYGDREPRPRDRFAPARAIPLMERGRLAPKHLDLERDRGGKDSDLGYDSRLTRTPMLGIPPTTKLLLPTKLSLLQRPNVEDNHSRPLLMHKRPSPLIPKSVEPSLDRYDDPTIKQSRIDLWVDQTLQGNNRLSNESFESEKRTKRTGDDERSFDEIKDKCSSLGSVSGGDVNESTGRTNLDEEKLELSDFSDDADDLLTQEPNPCLSTKSESSVKDDKLGSHDTHEILVESVKASEEPVSIEADKESVPTVVSASISSIPPATSYDLRDSRSLQSQSQTEDDILDEMHFEAISDEELGEVENKLSIVDVFGVNWASLLSREKSEVPSDELHFGDGLAKSVRQKWTPLQVFQEVGLSRKLCGDELFNKVLDRIKDSLHISEEDTSKSEAIAKDLERPLLQKRQLERRRLMDTYGVGSHTRALSAKRDMIVRRCLLHLPPKNFMSLEFGNQSSGPINTPQDPEVAAELLKLSLANYKNT